MDGFNQNGGQAPQNNQAAYQQPQGNAQYQQPQGNYQYQQPQGNYQQPVNQASYGNQAQPNNFVQESYFDGGLLQLIGWKILGSLITVCTLGICFPWAVCMIYDWETKHTVINGKRCYFDGHAIQLFGNWIKWILLTIITIGIYSFWVAIALKKWKTKHTHFYN